MLFKELLNELFDELKCSQSELSRKSGISRPAISRYISGEREPAKQSQQLLQLSSGLAAIAQEKQIKSLTLSNGETILLTEQSILSAFSKTFDQKNVIYESFVSDFTSLITVFSINMKKLAQSTNFDVSYLYRVKSGERRPSDLDTFCQTIGTYIVDNCNTEEHKNAFCQLVKCGKNEIDTKEKYFQKICSFLLGNNPEIANDEISAEQIHSFIHKLDEFDLDEYMRAIHFHDIKVPNIPFHKPIARNYYSVEQMRKGELDFLKSTVFSKSKETVFMCNDMPMDEMAEDMDFGKKWMFGIAMMLKKGLHLDVIHNIDRPFNEMMLGLEAWIPIYMTGQVSPYHLPSVSTDVYHHLNYVSGSVALTGECIEGYHDSGKYYITSNKNEVSYYKEKANHLLSLAEPLMSIYRVQEKQKYFEYIKSLISVSGKRHNIYTTLPLYTIPDELLDRMLAKNHVSEKEKQRIQSYVQFYRKHNLEILKNNTIRDDIVLLSEEEFQKHPMLLSFSDAFANIEIPYSYEEYEEHLKAYKEFADQNKNYEYTFSNDIPFRNIQIKMIEDHSVIVSKGKSPVIHFVIHHPKMVYAFQNFVSPV